MKKKIKYLIFIPIALIIIALLLYFFLIKNKHNLAILYTAPIYKPVITVPATSTPPDLSIMTKEEKIKLRVAPGLKVEVLRRNKDGFPTDYRITK